MDRIGTDESGKGDFFGPLVVGAVYVTDQQEKTLRKLGVKDCKLLEDKKVLALDEEIRKAFVFDVVKINPPKYNQLHEKFGNLNILLAWAHARAIENLLGKVECGRVVSDQFGDEKYLKERLMKKGRKVELIQRPRAEDDLAVAAASIVARATFLKGLEAMTQYWGIKFPKGASNVEHAGRMFVAAYGREMLSEVAKTHFRTMKRLDAGGSEES